MMVLVNVVQVKLGFLGRCCAARARPRRHAHIHRHRLLRLHPLVDRLQKLNPQIACVTWSVQCS